MSMPKILRIVAALLSLMTVGAPIALALFVSGVEPNRPPSAAFIAPLAFGGLACALGYIAIAAAPHRIAVASFPARLTVVGLLAIPFIAAVYLLIVTGSSNVTLISLVMIASTALLAAACFRTSWISDRSPEAK